MKKSTVYSLLGILVILVGVVYFTRGQTSLEPGKYDDFAKCLTESGTKMYGAYWCSHCAAQKKLFGSSVKYIPYVECDPRGDNADKAACDAAGVKGFPTWVFPDGTRSEGETSLRQLSIKTNCELPAGTVE